jgi:hypothetical protein
MTPEQYRLLLEDLARVAALADPSGLLEHGRIRIGEVDSLLVHDAAYDEHLLQVRMRLGTLPADGAQLARALLESNYVSGYGGECVFSLYPSADDVVITVRVRLQEQLTGQELWQAISDAARHGQKMWEGIVPLMQSSPRPDYFDDRLAQGLRA